MLELKNINYSILENGVEKKILHDISLKFDDNKVYVITGQNGSGKSTLLKIIMGIIAPASGGVIFDGQNISKLSIHERAKLGFSYAFQQPVKFKGITVKKLFEIVGSSGIKESCEYLSKVGLCAREYIDRLYDDKLSGGESKRIELALCLARRAKLNLFDEPEAGIDLWSFDSLIDIFKNISGTSIIISHQEKIMEIAHEVILLDSGKVVKIGTLDDVKVGKCGRLA